MGRRGVNSMIVFLIFLLLCSNVYAYTCKGEERYQRNKVNDRWVLEKVRDKFTVERFKNMNDAKIYAIKNNIPLNHIMTVKYGDTGISYAFEVWSELPKVIQCDYMDSNDN